MVSLADDTPPLPEELPPDTSCAVSERDDSATDDAPETEPELELPPLLERPLPWVESEPDRLRVDGAGNISRSEPESELVGTGALAFGKGATRLA